MVMPYLSFQGNCEEAFGLYARAFGGTIAHMARYGDMPENPDAPMDPATKAKVMHAQLQLTEGGHISGADAMTPVTPGNAVSIHVHLPGEAAARRAMEILAEGGQVLGPLTRNPPPDDAGISGAVLDRYGFQWILSAMADESL